MIRQTPLSGISVELCGLAENRRDTLSAPWQAWTNSMLTTTASFRMDEGYYQEMLGEWTASVSRLRKYEPFLCLLFVVLGAVAAVLRPRLWGVGALLAGIGLFEAAKYLRWKKSWLAARRSSPQFNREVVLSFSADSIRQTQPLPVATTPVEVRVVETARGLFLRLEKGGSVYVPYRSFDPPLNREELPAGELFRVAMDPAAIP